MNTNPETRTPSAFSPKLVIGIAVVLLGLALTLDNLGVVSSHAILRFWPLALIAIGIAKIRQAEGSATAGYVLVVAGTLIQLMVLGGRHIDELIGPLIVVSAGIFIVLHALKGHRKIPPELQQSSAFVRGTAIFSAFKHRHQGAGFRGGELTALFGGFEVDLRTATMDGDSARVDAFVMFGGGEIRIPEGWEVQVQATALFGGVDNKVLPPATFTEGPRPRLILTGLVLFGGIELK